MKWTLRDGLAAYLEIVRSEALEQYRTDMLAWAALAPHQKKPMKAPLIPSILQ